MPKQKTLYEFAQFLIEAEKLEKEGISVRKICKDLANKYGCTAEALRKRLKTHRKIVPEVSNKKKGKGKKGKGRGKNRNSQGKRGKAILNLEEETALVTLIKQASLMNHALAKQDIIKYVKRNHKFNHKKWNSQAWLKSFLARNNDVLKDKSLKIISQGRVQPSSIESMEEFIESVKQKSETFNMQDNNIVNVDEFQLKISGYTAGRRRITAVRPSGHIHKQVATDVRGGCVGSLISFICAEGTLLYSALCLKPDGKVRSKGQELYYIESDAIEEQGAGTRQRPIPQMRIYTPTGMIDGETWEIIYSGFLEHMNNTDPGKEYLVYMDNLPQHTNLNTIEKGLKQGVDSMFLPKGTSQFSQPSDNIPFGSMRKIINREGSLTMGKNINHEKLNVIIRDIVPKAMAKSFKPNQIKHAFEETGIYPFNEDILRRNTLENLGNLTDKSKNTLAELEEKVSDAITTIYKKDDEGKPTTKQRVKATIGLNQAYTSGHVLQMHEMEVQKQEDEARKKNEKKQAMEQKRKEKEREKELKRAALAEKRENARMKKEDEARKRNEKKLAKEQKKAALAKKSENAIEKK